MIEVEKTLISQYGTSSVIAQLVQNMGQYFDQYTNWENFYNFVWNVNTAQGFGLDIWGTIVGVSRLLHVPNSGLTFGFQDSSSPSDVTPFNVGPFNSIGSVSTQSYVLPDAGYRTLILTKALSNISAMSAPSINQLLQNLFPGLGNAYVIDNHDMSMTFFFAFPLTTVQEAIIAQSGVLAHPAGVQLNILVGGVSATANPTNIFQVGTSASETSASVTVTATEGSPAYTYAWTFISAGTGITITSPTSASTTFSASGLTAGQILAGTAQCTVTDSNGVTASCTVSVTVGRASAVSASAFPASINYVSNSSAPITGATTVTAAGGLEPYTYSWSFTTGGSGITIVSPASPITEFSTTGLSTGNTVSGTATCTVTDSLGQTTSVAVPVSISNENYIAHLYTNQASVTETIPSGFGKVVIEGWGPGGAGTNGIIHYFEDLGNFYQGGGGGGGGGYFLHTLTLNSGNWGQTIQVSATETGASVIVSSGTFSIATLTAGNGQDAPTATVAFGSPGGTGGAASGANTTNTTGNAGGAGSGSFTSGSQTAGAGATAITGINAGPYGAGGNGSATTSGAQGETPGAVNFYYTVS
jgi:hypothetical protein